jgi:hypothetical protein
MSELTSYRCPNCGAYTTNTQNCEYCGSLFVRFVKKGIDISTTTYLNNDIEFPGLLQNLKRNLELQDESGNEGVAVATDIVWENEMGDMCGCSILSTNSPLGWLDDTCFQDGADCHRGLGIILSFCGYVNGHSEYNEREILKLQKFKSLSSYALFTNHNSSYTDSSNDIRYDREYYIDFGEDAEGASRLISEILIEVYALSSTGNYDIFTNSGESIQKARDKWRTANGFDETKPTWYIVLVIILWILYFYYLVS